MKLFFMILNDFFSKGRKSVRAWVYDLEYKEKLQEHKRRSQRFYCCESQILETRRTYERKSWLSWKININILVI